MGEGPRGITGQRENRLGLLVRRLAKRPTYTLLIAITIILALSSVVVLLFESRANQNFRNIGDALWWALVTATTVGYGDRVPLTAGGRLVGILVMLFGVVLMAIVTGRIASSLVEWKMKEGMEKFLAFLKKKNVKTALVTNNSRKNLDFLLKKFRLSFDCLLSREAGLWKPSGAPFLFVLQKLGIGKMESCVIGDSHFDVKAAAEAGIIKIFLLAQDKERQLAHGVEAVQTVKELEEQISNIL